jgi:AcrR family transcriptional regulator
MTDEKRPYRKKKRAELEEETRLRITESAVELHGTVGPSRTTMSAVAERAGVRRSTLYRHFPDEAALFGACSAHWAEHNPPPNPEEWAAIGDPGERLTRALSDLYAFYGRTEQMLVNLFRDEEVVPSVGQRFTAFHQLMGFYRETLMKGRGSRGRARRRESAAVAHALDFHTWRSLVREQGLEPGEAVELMARLAGQSGK